MKARIGVERLDERIAPAATGSLRAALASARAERIAEMRAARAERLAVVRAARAARLAALRAPALTTTVAVTQPAPAPLISQVVIQPPSRVPAGPATNVDTPPLVPEPSPTPDPADVKEGPLAKAGADLIALYTDFTADGRFDSGASDLIRIEGTSVGVDVQAGGDLTALTAQLQGLGMVVEQVDARTGIIEGMVPINQLLAVASLSQVDGMRPIYKPTLRR